MCVAQCGEMMCGSMWTQHDSIKGEANAVSRWHTPVSPRRRAENCHPPRVIFQNKTFLLPKTDNKETVEPLWRHKHEVKWQSKHNLRGRNKTGTTCARSLLGRRVTLSFLFLLLPPTPKPSRLTGDCKHTHGDCELWENLNVHAFMFWAWW